jgi:putative transposase
MVNFVRTCFQVSIRRACRAVPACRASYHYRAKRADQSILRKRIREIAETRPLRLSPYPHHLTA